MGKSLKVNKITEVKKEITFDQRKLDEEALVLKAGQIEDLTLTEESLELQLGNFKRMKELRLPERELDMKIRETEKNLKMIKQNLTVLKKQVREKRELMLKN